MLILQTAALIENGTALAPLSCPLTWNSFPAFHDIGRRRVQVSSSSGKKTHWLSSPHPGRYWFIYRTCNSVKIRLFQTTVERALRISRHCYKNLVLEIYQWGVLCPTTNDSEDLTKISLWSKMVLCADTHFFKSTLKFDSSFAQDHCFCLQFMKVSEIYLPQQTWNDTWCEETRD